MDMKTSDIVVRPLHVEHDADYERYRRELNELIGQLSNRATFEAAYALKSFLEQATLFVAFAGGKIVGMLTLFILRKPTGQFALIEDVIVDEAHRKMGIGHLLMEAAITVAMKEGSGYIELTSHSRRVAANRLYPSLGFERRDTNVYRLPLAVRYRQQP